jgi:NAD+ synthase
MTSNANAPLGPRVLELDYDREIERMCSRLKEILSRDLSRRGLVVAISGGIDSSVSAALSVRAIGAERVYGLLLPEQDSSGASVTRGRMLAEHLGIRHELFDIAPTLEAIGCYRWRDEAIRNVFPEYGAGWKNKIVISGGLEGRVNHFQLVVQTPAGETRQARLGLKDYLQIVAATNFKQRIRKTVEYFHADRLNYAVVGTPNRLEYDQGFFVKNGDGSADVKPIAHLYKTQVYALARHMGLPGEICSATPTTDTYSLPQGQDEFYFSLPYAQMDIALWALNHGRPAAELAAALGIKEAQAQHVFNDIEAKRRTTRYLHSKAVLVEAVPELAIPRVMSNLSD